MIAIGRRPLALVGALSLVIGGCTGASSRSVMAGQLVVKPACSSGPCLTAAPAPAARDIAVVRRDQGRVAVAHSDAAGRFRVRLDPGDYALSPLGSDTSRCGYGQVNPQLGARGLVALVAGQTVQVEVSCTSACVSAVLLPIQPGQAPPSTAPAAPSGSCARGSPEPGATLAAPLPSRLGSGVTGVATSLCPEHVACGGQPVAVNILGFGPDGALENATSTGPDGRYRLALLPGPHELRVYLQQGQQPGGGEECTPAEPVIPPSGFVLQDVNC